MDFTKAKQFPTGSATVDNCYSYLDCDVVIIDRYAPSRLETVDICLAQDELPGGGTVFFFERDYFGSIALRIPTADTYPVHIYVDGEEYSFARLGERDQPRYALVSGPFEPGCRVRIEICAADRDTKIPAGSNGCAQDDTAVSGDGCEQDDLPVGSHDCTRGCTPISSAPIIYTDNGTVRYNNTLRRYLVSMAECDSQVSLSLGEGYVFGSTDLQDEAADRAHSFDVSSDLFTGYEITIIAALTGDEEAYDLVIMQPADDEGCLVHAYTPTIGAFAGETCYIIDSASVQASAAVTDSATAQASAAVTDLVSAQAAAHTFPATHGSRSVQELGIDPLTGYKWGRMERNCYFFELENGSYELVINCSAGMCIILNPGRSDERVLAEAASGQEQHFRFRAASGSVTIMATAAGKSGVDCSSDCGSADSCPADCGSAGSCYVEDEATGISRILIRALDTTAVDSGYVLISSADNVKNEATEYSISDSDFSIFAEASPASARKTLQKRRGDSHSSAVSSHINNKLAAQKSRQAAKTLGIATGALAVAAGLISLLGRDRD